MNYSIKNKDDFKLEEFEIKISILTKLPKFRDDITNIIPYGLIFDMSFNNEFFNIQDVVIDVNNKLPEIFIVKKDKNNYKCTLLRACDELKYTDFKKGMKFRLSFSIFSFSGRKK